MDEKRVARWYWAHMLAAVVCIVALLMSKHVLFSHPSAFWVRIAKAQVVFEVFAAGTNLWLAYCVNHYRLTSRMRQHVLSLVLAPLMLASAIWSIVAS